MPIGSVQFPHVFLRMDGHGVTAPVGAGAGTVNCQFGFGDGPYEQFTFVDQGDGMVAIASVQFPNVYLRMDGNGVTAFAGAGAGTANCQFGVGSWEKFRLIDQGPGVVSIESVQFPGVFLRMDGNGVKDFAGAGAGKVNCQFGAGPYEKFRIRWPARVISSTEIVTGEGSPSQQWIPRTLEFDLPAGYGFVEADMLVVNKYDIGVEIKSVRPLGATGKVSVGVSYTFGLDTSYGSYEYTVRIGVDPIV